MGQSFSIYRPFRSLLPLRAPGSQGYFRKNRAESISTCSIVSTAYSSASSRTRRSLRSFDSYSSRSAFSSDSGLPGSGPVCSCCIEHCPRRYGDDCDSRSSIYSRRRSAYSGETISSYDSDAEYYRYGRPSTSRRESLDSEPDSVFILNQQLNEYTMDTTGVRPPGTPAPAYTRFEIPPAAVEAVQRRSRSPSPVSPRTSVQLDANNIREPQARSLSPASQYIASIDDDELERLLTLVSALRRQAERSIGVPDAPRNRAEHSRRHRQSSTSSISSASTSSSLSSHPSMVVSPLFPRRQSFPHADDDHLPLPTPTFEPSFSWSPTSFMLFLPHARLSDVRMVQYDEVPDQITVHIKDKRVVTYTVPDGYKRECEVMVVRRNGVLGVEYMHLWDSESGGEWTKDVVFRKDIYAAARFNGNEWEWSNGISGAI